jgi:hypothetical protein
MESENDVFTSYNQDAIGMRQLLYFRDQGDQHLDNNSSVKGHMHQLFEMFVSYRILDLLALVEGIPCLKSFPRQIKLPNLGHAEKNVSYTDSARFDR